MALLKRLVQMHRDLKNISSIEHLLFKVPGCAHPVELSNITASERSYYAAATETVLPMHQMERPGDILLFLTGNFNVETKNACQSIKSGR